MTDREFLDMMRDEYGVEDFCDAADMCNNLLRFMRIATEIAQKNGDDTKKLDIISSALYDCADRLIEAYLD